MNDIKIIIDARKQTNADFIITTEKDAVRLRRTVCRISENGTGDSCRDSTGNYIWRAKAR